MRVRSMGLADVAAVARIHCDAWVHAYRGLVPDELLDGLDTARREEQWRGTVRDDTGSCTNLVVVDEATGAGRVVGFVGFGEPKHDTLAQADRVPVGGGLLGELHYMYCDPAVIGRGFGRFAHHQVVEMAREQGYTHLAVWVLEGNTVAQRFYTAAGYKPTGVNRTLPGVGVVTLMSRGLA